MTQFWRISSDNRAEKVAAAVDNAAEPALTLSPTLMDAYVVLDLTSLLAGQPEKVIETAQKAIRLSPRDPQLFIFISHEASAYLTLEKYDQAMELASQSLALNSAPTPNWFLLITAQMWSGHDAGARQTLLRYLSLPGVRTRTLAAYKRNAIPLR